MWSVRFSFRVEDDVVRAALWYEAKQPGLGPAFVDEIVQVWRELTANPFLAARRHPTRNLGWRYPARFPYRIIYEIDERHRTVVVLRVVHAAQDDSRWRV